MTVKISAHTNPGEIPNEAAIHSFIKNHPSEGAILLAEDRKRGFLESTPLAGEQTTGFIARDESNILGLISWSEIEVQMSNDTKTDFETDCDLCEKKSARIALLSGLRLGPSKSTAMVFLRGLRALKRYAKLRSVDRVLAFVMEENSSFRHALVSPNRRAFQSEDLGTYYTLFFSPATKGKLKKENPGLLQIRRARREDYEDLLGFIQREGQAKQFFPLINEQDLTSEGFNYRGLSIDNFILARNDSRIIGCLAVWDQSPFREWIVSGYRNVNWFKRVLLNCLTRFRGGIALPAIGERFSCAYLAFVCVGDCLDIFEPLLEAALSSTNKPLVLGLHENNPLLPKIKAFSAQVIKSRLLSIDLLSGQKPANVSRTEQVYFDVGLL